MSWLWPTELIDCSALAEFLNHFPEALTAQVQAVSSDNGAIGATPTTRSAFPFRTSY
jgi:hypothetical protein